MKKMRLILTSLLTMVSIQSCASELDYHNWEKDLQIIKEIAKDAGTKTLEIRNSNQLEAKDVLLQNGKKVRQTNADIEASRYITDKLVNIYPSYGFISQDQMEFEPHWYEKEFIWIVNPIDGTRAFEKGGDDFCVQIGLLAGNEPVLGVSYYPAKTTFVWAVKGQGSWLETAETKQQLQAAPCNENILLIASSRTYVEPYLKEWNWIPTKVSDESFSSTSRLLHIIQGKASLYISLGASPKGKEKKGAIWNFGANSVIANEAGLLLRTLRGAPLNLREPTALLTEGVLITTDSSVYSKIVQSDVLN